MKSQVFICIISSVAASRFARVMFVTTAGQIFKICIQFVTYKWFHAIVAVAGSMHLWHLRTNVKALMQMRQKWEEKWRCHHTSCLFRFSATKLHSRVLSSQLLFFWLSSFWFELNAKNPYFFQLSIFRCIFEKTIWSKGVTLFSWLSSSWFEVTDKDLYLTCFCRYYIRIIFSYYHLNCSRTVHR